MNGTSFPKWVSIVVTVLVAFGVPGTVIGIFYHFVLMHPLLSFAITALYEIGVFVFGRVAKIWERLESRWIDRIVDSVDTFIQESISGTYQKYCEHLRYQHRFQEFSGMALVGEYSFLLDQVFVDLKVVSRPVHDTSSNPVQALSNTPGEENHSIWYYLASQQEKRSLVIIGASGSGKTTLLKHLTLALVAHKRQIQRSYRLPQNMDFPIFLYLRDYAEMINDRSDFSLEEAVQRQCKEWGQDLPKGWIQQRLEKGHCLVLLDGLDEITDDMMRQVVVQWVQKQINTYGKSCFIITSRPFGYRGNPLNGVVVLQVQPFSHEQIKHFIRNWCLAYEVTSKRLDDVGVRKGAKKEAEKLLRHLRDAPALLELAVNPLLLTMIATVHRYRSTLPQSRVELYKEVCEVFLARRQMKRGIKLDLNAEQQLLVLQPLAYYLMNRRKQTIRLEEARQVIDQQGYLKRVNSQMTSEAFLSLVETRSGLLLEQKSGEYGFAHKTFQEYLAARFIKDNHLERVLIDRIQNESWHETIRFYCAQTDASTIVGACLASNPPSVAALTLAIDCNEESLSIDDNVRKQLDTMLNHDVESGDSARRRVVAEALLTRRLRQMAHLSDETSIDTSLITCAEYQLFLDSQDFSYHPYHWNAFHFSQGEGHSPIRGVLRLDAQAFCQWLNTRDRGSLWTYRLPRRDEVEEANNEKLLESSYVFGCWLMNDTPRRHQYNSLLAPKASVSELLISDPIFDLPIILSMEVQLNSALYQVNFAHIFDAVLSDLFDLKHKINQDTFSLYVKVSTSVDINRELANDLAHARFRALFIAKSFDAHKHSGDYNVLSNWLNPKLDISELPQPFPNLKNILTHARHFVDTFYAFFRTIRPYSSRLIDDVGPLLNVFSEGIGAAAEAHKFSDNVDLIITLIKVFDRSYYLVPFLKQNGGEMILVELCDLVCLLMKVFIMTSIRQRQVLSYKQESFFLSLLRRLIFWQTKEEQEEMQDYQALITVYLNIYVAFALLELRTLEFLPPCEGILLVKEHRKSDTFDEEDYTMLP